MCRNQKYLVQCCSQRWYFDVGRDFSGWRGDHTDFHVLSWKCECTCVHRWHPGTCIIQCEAVLGNSFITLVYGNVAPTPCIYGPSVSQWPRSGRHGLACSKSDRTLMGLPWTTNFCCLPSSSKITSLTRIRSVKYMGFSAHSSVKLLWLTACRGNATFIDAHEGHKAS